MKRYFYTLLLICLYCMAANAQTRSAGGVVYDKSDGKPLSYISVYFKNTSSGCITDFGGNFFLSDGSGADTLVVDAIGYVKQTIVLGGRSNTDMTIFMQPFTETLDGAVVRPEKYSKRGNPAVDLIRKVIANKDNNRIENYPSYKCDLYEKLTLSLDDFNPDFDKRKGQSYLKEYIDTSEITGNPILTLSVRESLGEYYSRKFPGEKKFVRKAQRHEGLDREFDRNGGLTANLELLFTGVDIFDNDISFLMNRFVSPLSSALAVSYYKYYIVDTVMVGDTRCIDMAFFPHNPQSYGFTGNLYVTDDGRYSVRKVQLNFPSRSNVNWIDKLRIDLEYGRNEDGLCVLEREDSYVNFSVIEGTQGVFAHQVRIFSNYVPDAARPEDLGTVVYDNSAWADKRPLPLTDREEAVARTADDIAKNSSAVTWMRVIDAVFSEWVPSTGSKATSKFDFGPLFSVFGYNYIEGPRFKLGGMTTANLSKRWFADGYLAYGLNDRKLKGSITLTHSFSDKNYHANEKPLNNLSVSYSYDIYSPEITGAKHDLLTSLKTGKVMRMQYIRNASVRYDKQWSNSLTTGLWMKNARYEPATLAGPSGEGTLRYEKLLPDGTVVQVPGILTTEIGASLRWAPGEKTINSVSKYANMDRNTPVFLLEHTLGLKGVGGEYSYNHTEFSVFKRIPLSIAGFMDARLSAGKVWNSVPWPLLIIPAANQSFVYKRETFQMMNALEFITDQYVQLHLTWHLKGMVFNRIPLLKELKLRELVVFNAVYGSLTDKNNPACTPGLFMLPYGTSSLERMPYMEVGAGVENILRFFRVVYFYRLSYRDNHLSWMGKWGGLRFGLYVDF